MRDKQWRKYTRLGEKKQLLPERHAEMFLVSIFTKPTMFRSRPVPLFELDGLITEERMFYSVKILGFATIFFVLSA